MAKPKEEQPPPEAKPKTKSERWREIVARRDAKRTELNAICLEADALESEIAEELIKAHGGKPIMIDGVEYVGKASPKRKVDGVEKVPTHPFQLVRYSRKEPANITI